jgi:UDP-glucuronate 4-epimerase
MYPMQQGDVFQTYADMTALEKEFECCPKMDLEGGIKRFVEWYKDTFYKNINVIKKERSI